MLVVLPKYSVCEERVVMEKLTEKKSLEDFGPDDLVDTGNPQLDRQFREAWDSVADLLLKGVPQTVVVVLLQSLIEQARTAATHEIEVVLAQAGNDNEPIELTQSERERCTLAIPDAALDAIWNGALLLLKQGKSAITIHELNSLLKLGARAAEKMDRKLDDEAQDAKYNNERLAALSYNRYGAVPGY